MQGKKCCLVQRLNDRTWDLLCTVPDTYTYISLPKLEWFIITFVLVYVCVCLCVLRKLLSKLF